MRIIQKVAKKFNLQKFFSKMLSVNVDKELIHMDKTYFRVFSEFMLNYLDMHRMGLISNDDKGITQINVL